MMVEQSLEVDTKEYHYSVFLPNGGSVEFLEHMHSHKSHCLRPDDNLTVKIKGGYVLHFKIRGKVPFLRKLWNTISTGRKATE